MKIRLRMAGKEWPLLIVFYLLLFQDPLALVIPIFQYTDECMGLVGPALYMYRLLQTGRLKLSRKNLHITLPLLIFLLAGVVANWLYNYQIKSAVLTDIYVNFKFFLCILTGYELVQFFDMENCKRVFLGHAKFAAILLAVLTFADLLFNLFDSPGLRYGIRIVQLFYFHPTNLAAAATFLLATQTLFYEKKNNFYLIAAAIVCIFTLRGKAIATVAIYAVVYFFVLKQRQKLKLWQMGIIGLVALLVAWNQVSYYYIELEGASARSALTLTSLQIAKDYFPIGTGFGTYASAVASEFYSPVYIEYGLNAVHGLTEGTAHFGSDTFWPIIIGQTGFIGTACYAYILVHIFNRFLFVRRKNLHAYVAGVFMFVFLMISSTSEPTFCNVVSIPIAVLIGFIFAEEQNNSLAG